MSMALDRYLAELGKYPLLTPDRELEVARASRAGDSTSKELLINSNLRLVVSIAKRYSRDGILPDLIGEGNIALIVAAEKYDPERGAKFSTYAFKGIERHIWSYLDSQKMIRLPPVQKALMRTIYRISNEYLIANSEEPTPQHIADELNRKQTKKRYTERDINELLQMYENSSVGSLNRSIGDDGDSEKMDFVPGEDGREMVEDLIGKSIADKVRVQINQLKVDETDKAILDRVLYEHQDFNDIATALDLRREQVKQRYERGLRVLRSNLRDSGIFDN
jgi:RNA polymerase nonessential primary-like sigma factor